MAEAYYHAPNFASYYDLEHGYDDDFHFCLKCAAQANSVLDLGCGTGSFAAVIAPNRRVVAIDPAQAMIDIARWKSGKVAWIVDDARTFRMDEKFDLITMQGHAFQVFLNDEDRLAVLKTIKNHLAPKGRFIFDSRNPAVRAWETWTAEKQKMINHPTFGRTILWTTAQQDKDGIVTYTKHFQIDGSANIQKTTCRLSFPDKDHLHTLIEMAGLKVLNWYGDWQGSAFSPELPELVAYGCLSSGREK